MNIHSFRNIVPIPILKYYSKFPDGSLKWLLQLSNIFFYHNQAAAFDCYLIILNNEVHIAYNRKAVLSCDFCDFIFRNLPKHPRDKRKKVFLKPVQRN